MERERHCQKEELSEQSATQPLDAQFAELIETVWACECRWDLELRIDAALKYWRNKS